MDEFNTGFNAEEKQPSSSSSCWRSNSKETKQADADVFNFDFSCIDETFAKAFRYQNSNSKRDDQIDQKGENQKRESHESPIIAKSLHLGTQTPLLSLQPDNKTNFDFSNFDFGTKTKNPIPNQTNGMFPKVADPFSQPSSDFHGLL